MHKTAAWPLALTYVALIVYASLYPFTEWRDQGMYPWTFLASPLPQYWTGFDVAANVLGYAPLGFLLVLSSLRSAGPGARPYPVLIAVASAAVLSVVMEALQSYLPARVASNVDLALNVFGAWLGAVLAWALERMGAIDRWERFRNRWFVADARGGLVLLALWPAALLFPASLPFGLGQVFERLEAALANALQDTPFLDWLPVRDVELQPLVPGMELACVLLGALIPCLLGYCIIRSAARRAVFMVFIFAVGLAATALSAALSWGPSHAWAWFSLPVQVGVVAAVLAATALIALPRRGCAALLLMALSIHLSLLNQAPAGAYFSQTLQTWEQGRFIRFHGLAQWLGWVWPYAALAYVLLRVSRRDPKD